MKPRVSLLHSKDDEQIVRELSERLKKDGFVTWVSEGLLPGQVRVIEVDRAFKNSIAILLCISKSFISEEGNIQKDYRTALDYQMIKPEGDIYVIPVTLDESEIPYSLRDLASVDYPKGYLKLISALNEASQRTTETQSSQQPLVTNQNEVSVERFKQVRLVLEGDINEFDETRREDLIIVLASMLHVNSENIRILRVYTGSIIVVVEASASVIDQLVVLALRGDPRLKEKGILSVQVEGEQLIKINTKANSKDSETSHTSNNISKPTPLLARAEANSVQQTFMFDAFISYSHKDREAVYQLVSRLRHDNFKLWLDEEQIGGGDPLRDAMVQGIKQSRHVIVCLSPNYLQSEWTTFESLVNQTLDPVNRKRRMIPVKIATVDEIPPEYSYVYCPDLTNMDEMEYQKAIMRIRESKLATGPTDESPVESIDQRVNSAGLNDKPQPPKPTARLEAMGFRYNPFAWPDAERMDIDVLERTYTYPSQYNENVMDSEVSSVLLAPFGGGKTAGRLRLKAELTKIQTQGIKKGGGNNNIPLVVEYTNFEDIYEQLPGKITVESHKLPLLDGIADSIFEFISSNPDSFLNLGNRDRDYWWAFIETYRLGIPLASVIRNEILLKDFQKTPRRSAPVIQGSNLSRIVEELVNQLSELQITSVVILVDGVDSQTAKQSDMESIIAPLINYKGLFSIPGLLWKFFLPIILEELVVQSGTYKTLRIKALPIKWDQDKLREFLTSRLMWASDERTNDIAKDCEQKLITELGDITARLAQLALKNNQLGPPRAILELAYKLYHIGNQQQITINDWRNIESLFNRL